MGLEKKLNVVDLGLLRYGEALKVQEKLVGARARDEINDTLIFVEHPPTITKGARTKEGDVKLNEEELRRLGIEIYEIERGGAAFLHNPGQIVGYPIRLADPGNKGNYMRLLQQILIDVGKEFGVQAVRHPKREYDIGAWYQVSEDLYHKVGAVGVQFRSINGRHVTMHGFALNVNNDVDIFRNISMCGCDVETGISLKKILGQNLSVEEVKERLLRKIVENLGYFSVHKYNSINEILQRGVLA